METVVEGRFLEGRGGNVIKADTIAPTMVWKRCHHVHVENENIGASKTADAASAQSLWQW
jgi:hypothetical protein